MWGIEWAWAARVRLAVLAVSANGGRAAHQLSQSHVVTAAPCSGCHSHVLHVQLAHSSTIMCRLWPWLWGLRHAYCTATHLSPAASPPPLLPFVQAVASRSKLQAKCNEVKAEVQDLTAQLADLRM